jgi:hypothetical protein
VILTLALLALCVLLTSSQNAGAPRGSGRSPGGGGGPHNVANPPGYVPEPRLPPPPSSTPPTLDQLNKLTPFDFDPAQGLRLGDFTLWTVDDLGRPDPTLLAYLRFEERNMEFGAVHLVVYTKGAPSLNDLTFFVRYHQERMHPRQIEPGSFFGFKGDRLELARLNVPGLVVAAFTRVRPDRIGGTKQQDLTVCEIVFEERPFDYKPVLLTHAPLGPENRARNVQAFIDNVSFDNVGPNQASGEVVLYWEGRNVGDYNNDGEVMANDIIPIGRRYGNLVTDGVEDEWDRMAETSGDNVVSYRDMFAIQANFGANLSGYRVYRRPGGSPRSSEELLRHPTYPLLPFSIHRPVAWDPIGRYGYYFFDKSLPRGGTAMLYTYRIVPYDAVGDNEGLLSDVEVTVSVSATNAEVVGLNAGKGKRTPVLNPKRVPNPVRGRT